MHLSQAIKSVRRSFRSFPPERELETNTNGLDIDKEEETKSLNSLKSEIIELRKCNREIQEEKLRESKKKDEIIKNLRNELNSFLLEESLKTLKSGVIIQQKEQIQYLRDELDTLANKHAEVNRKNEFLEEEKKNLELLLNSAMNEDESILKSENMELKHEIFSLKIKIGSKNSLIENLTKEKEAVGNLLETTLSEKNEIESVVKSENKELKSQISSLEIKLASFKNKKDESYYANDNNQEFKCSMGNYHDLNYSIGYFGLRRKLIGHHDYVFAFTCFENDGINYLVSGSYDRCIKIWDLRKSSNENTATLFPSANIYSLKSFEMNQTNFITSAGYSNDIEIWNISEKKLEYTLKGHRSFIFALVTFVKNGHDVYLISGSDDHTIKLWNLKTRSCVYTLQGHTNSVRSLDTFQKDGKSFLASGSYDNSVKIWDLDDKSLITTLEGHTHWIRSIVIFYKKGTPILASGSRDNTVNIWNLNNYQLIETLRKHTNRISSLSFFNLDEKLFLASGSCDNTIKLWNMENYTLFKSLQVPSHSRSLTSFTFSVDNKKENDNANLHTTSYLISGHCDGNIMIWSK